MAKITNPNPRRIVLPTGHIVPAGGELATTNDVLNSADNAPMLRSMALAGQVGLAYDAETPGADVPAETKIIEPTPEVVAVADTLDLLADSASPPLPKTPRVPRPSNPT